MGDENSVANIATIKAYFTQEHSIKREWGDKNSVCIFPARYTWLNEKLGLPKSLIALTFLSAFPVAAFFPFAGASDNVDFMPAAYQSDFWGAANSCSQKPMQENILNG